MEKTLFYCQEIEKKASQWNIKCLFHINVRSERSRLNITFTRILLQRKKENTKIDKENKNSSHMPLNVT